MVGGASQPEIPGPRIEEPPRERAADYSEDSARPPTRRAIRLRRVKRGGSRLPSSATPILASSRSTPTSRTPRSATNSRRLQPERFFENFIAEQVMVGAAMGLAARGAIPFPSTFACFLTRASDFIRMGAISFANVKLTGSHAGVSIGEDGPSQMALEDLSMMRRVHGCAVLYPCDAVSTERLVVADGEAQGHGLHAHVEAEDAGDLRARRAVPDWRIEGRCVRARTTRPTSSAPA